MDENSWLKLNSILRILGIIILLLILVSILYFRYGTPQNLEDMQLLNSTGSKITDCREALIYYAESKMVITPNNPK